MEHNAEYLWTTYYYPPMAQMLMELPPNSELDQSGANKSFSVALKALQNLPNITSWLGYR